MLHNLLKQIIVSKSSSVYAIGIILYFCRASLLHDFIIHDLVIQSWAHIDIFQYTHPGFYYFDICCCKTFLEKVKHRKSVKKRRDFIPFTLHFTERIKSTFQFLFVRISHLHLASSSIPESRWRAKPQRNYLL